MIAREVTGIASRAPGARASDPRTATEALHHGEDPSREVQRRNPSVRGGMVSVLRIAVIRVRGGMVSVLRIAGIRVRGGRVSVLRTAVILVRSVMVSVRRTAVILVRSGTVSARRTAVILVQLVTVSVLRTTATHVRLVTERGRHLGARASGMSVLSVSTTIPRPRPGTV